MHFVCLPRNDRAVMLVCFLFHPLPIGVNILGEKSTSYYQYISSSRPRAWHSQMLKKVYKI